MESKLNKSTITIRIEDEILSRARSIAHYTPGLTLSEFIQEAMREYQKEYPDYPEENIRLKKGRRI